MGRCHCCPYGFHIDLGFVDFAENAVKGIDSIKKYNSNPRKKPRRQAAVTPSIDEYATSRPTATDEDWWTTASPMDSSIMSQSTNGIDIDDELPTHELPVPAQYLGKQKSDSHVMRLIGELSGIENARKPPLPPPVASSTPYPPADLNNSSRSQGWAGFNGSDTFSRSQTAASGRVYPGTINRELTKSVPPSLVNSATTNSIPSPIKTYHAAVAESAARSPPEKKQPTPPRRYFDSARPRVLSPEPAARSPMLPPTALRTSNIHSRASFISTSNGNNLPSSPEAKAPARIAYRGALTSNGLDFSSFASVRRQRGSTEDGGRTLPRNGGPFVPRVDGYTSDAEYRSELFDRQNYRYDAGSTPRLNGVDPLVVTKVAEQTALPTKPSKNFSHSSTQATVIPVEVKTVGTVTEERKRGPTPPPKPAPKSGSTQTTAIEAAEIAVNTDPPEEPKFDLSKLSIEFQFAVGHEPEFLPGEHPELAAKKVETAEIGTRPIRKALFEMGINTDPPPVMINKACMPMPPPVKPKTSEKSTETDEPETIKVDSLPSLNESSPEPPKDPQPSTLTSETQTETDWIEDELRRRMKAERAERKSVDKITETEEDDTGEFIMITCSKCDSSNVAEATEHYEKIVDDEEPSQADGESGFSNSSTDLDEFERLEKSIQNEGELTDLKDHPTFDGVTDSGIKYDGIVENGESPAPGNTVNIVEVEYTAPPIDENAVKQRENLDVPPEPLHRNSMASEPDFSDHDNQSLDTVSIATMVYVDPASKKEEKTPPKDLDSSKIEAIRKLLTEPTRNSAFTRESGAYRSYRAEKSKTTDDLDFIAAKHSANAGKDEPTEPSQPSEGSAAALHDVVHMKKAVPIVVTPPLTMPEMPARIPRPKVSHFSIPEEQAQTPDEEAEAADRLTPLRSELRSLYEWGHSGAPFKNDFRRLGASPLGQVQSAGIDQIEAEDDDANDDDDLEGEIQKSGASSDSEGTYEVSDNDDPEVAADFELTAPLKEALELLHEHLLSPEETATQAVDWANKYVQHEWLKGSTKRKSSAVWVDKFLDALENYSVALMSLVVNYTDNNGNTALHYAVSHENYDLVSVLLDSKVADVDKMNQAGYSPVMLASLCENADDTHYTIIERLFEIGNINAKAIKHGQTALQLASSHGRVRTTELLLKCGADVNIQDVDGSTALMCAAEHGHIDIVKLLLKNSHIDASLTDCDNQTALSIACEQKHKALALLIYAHLNYSRTTSSNSCPSTSTDTNAASTV
uniref:ANK_REP_REGION domain-containing protein n=1 Tax=Panagrellus redivivus TaxID=6233 RepID=A0A7E4UMC9_PANRE